MIEVVVGKVTNLTLEQSNFSSSNNFFVHEALVSVFLSISAFLSAIVDSSEYNVVMASMSFSA